MIDEEEKNVIEKNKEIENNIKYQIRSDSNIIAKKIQLSLNGYFDKSIKKLNFIVSLLSVPYFLNNFTKVMILQSLNNKR